GSGTEIPNDVGTAITSGNIDASNLNIEAGKNLIFDRNTLVETNGNNPKFIGSLLEPENIDSEQGIPLEDIPIFQNLTLKVDPPSGQTGLLDIQGSFAVTENLLLENTNGNIIIEPQLPQVIDFTSGKNLEYRGSNGSLFVGLSSLLSGVEPHGDDRQNSGSVNINARQGSVELLRGITLNADTDLNIAAQRFIGSGTTSLLGNGINGEPGRIDSDSFQTYTIGVISFGGSSLDNTTGQPIFNDAGEIQLSEESIADPEPELQLVVGFNPDNPNIEQPQPVVLPGEENTDATGNVKILLLFDQSFEVGEFDPTTQSGIASIARISRISTNGSLVGNVLPIEETLLGSPPPEPSTSSDDNKGLEDILEEYGLELQQVSDSSTSSIAKKGSSSNAQSQPELATNSDEIALEIESDSEVATGAGQSTSNTESSTEQSISGESTLATTSSSSSSNGTEFNNSSANQTSGNVATGTNSNSDVQANNNSGSRRGISSNGQSQQQSTITNSSSTSSNGTESNDNSANQTGDSIANQTNSSSASQASSSAVSGANSNAASEASDAANQASSNAASDASNAANQANSNAASEASDAVNQANSNAANLPASKTSPLPQNSLDPLSQAKDNSTVALLPEEPEVNLNRNPIKDWALPIAGGLLLTGGAGTLLANALLGNSISSVFSNMLNSLASNILASNPTLKPEANTSNSNNKSDQENPQQDNEIEMETTIEPGIMQLSEFPLLDLEISLELEPDSGKQTIHVKNNLIDYDLVEVKSE
ncbi:MAG: hypothetical protein AB4372_30335, partial [Xenococcus sp. (in: cyanobacteria)]